MEELLQKLRHHDIDISVVDNNLKIEVPESFQNESLLEELKRSKSALIEYITERKYLNQAISDIAKGSSEAIFRLTPPQLRLFILNEFKSDTIAYNLFQVYLFDGLIDYSNINDIFRQLIVRHESLRTCFFLNDLNEPVQKILEDFDFDINHYQLEGVDLEAIIQDFNRPFDLSKAPLIRVGLVKISSTSHMLLLDMHHIISDGVSQEVLVNDFVSLYNGLSLPPIEISYKDYAHWYYSSMHQQVIDSHKKFWLKEFKDYTSILELPCDFARPKEKSYQGASYQFSLGVEESRKLEELAKSAGTSVFVVLLSAYSILLSKLSGSEELVIGTPSAGRVHADLEKIIGMFVNTLPLHLAPKSTFSFIDFVNEVSLKVFAFFDHQEYPYEQLVDDLKLGRNEGHNPLFDVLFVYQSATGNSAKVKDLEITPYHLSRKTSKFDLALYVFESGNGFNLDIEYSTELFKFITIERYAGYFQSIINQILQNKHLSLSEISLLSALDRGEVCELNTNIDVTYPKELTVVELFEKQVLETPDQIAVVFGEVKLTYRSLNERSNQLAHALNSRGVRRESIVGLMLEKSAETIIAMLGILKAGGAYMPIDVDYPPERIKYMLTDSEAKHIVTSKNYLHLLVDYQAPYTLLEDTRENSSTNPQISNQPEDLIYVLYTSGTTGKSKGVMVEHRNVVRLLFNSAFQFDFRADDVWTMFHSHCFDFSVWEIYGALLRGGKLVVISPQQARDPKEFLKVLIQEGVTVLNQTPTAFYSLINIISEEELSAIRYVIFGGEALTPAKLKPWYFRYPSVKLINMFGITETTVHSTYKEIGVQEIEHNTCSIGRQLPTVTIYLLDANKNFVPPGVIGELHVGGLGVARGYLNNESLTAERFIMNPYCEGERLYRSGDLARLMDNGEFEYIGRGDHQVQLKGFRIELGEIEAKLIELDQIKECVVVLSEHNEEKCLIAYYVAESTLEVSDLRAFLSINLPLYMIPSYYVRLEYIPQTSNNKVDRTKLAELKVEVMPGAEPPKNEAQQKIVNIWQKNLTLEKVGIRDNYFSLGGDSLKAIRLISEINIALQCSLSIADLYSHQTIEALDVIAGQKRTADNNYKLAEEQLQIFREEYIAQKGLPEIYEDVYPMNGVEMGMVFHTMKENSNQDEHNIIYHEQNLYTIPHKNFDFELFRLALNLLVTNHGELRKVYDLDSFAHLIKKEITPEIGYIDVSGLERKEQKCLIQDLMDKEKLRKNGLSFSQIWRMNIIKLDSDLHLLIFDMHHSLLDGWSLSSFITELNNTYFYLQKDPKYKPSVLKSNYKDQILTEIAASLKKENVFYWQEELRGYHRLDFTRVESKHTFKKEIFDLGDQLRVDLEGLAADNHTSFKHLCFAAYVYTMKMFSFSNDVLVGLITNIRPLKEDGEELLGCFLNTVPFRAQIPEKIIWKDYVTYIENKLRRQKSHEQVPLYKILSFIEEFTNDGNPLFDTYFNFIDFRVFNALIEDQKDPIEDLGLDNFLNSNILLDFCIRAHNQHFKLVLNYSTSIMDEKVSRRVYEYFKNVLYQFVKAWDKPISNIDILPEEEKNQLLYEYNATKVDYPIDKTIIDLFEEQVKKTPDNIAIWCGESSTTYRVLKEKSDKVAIYLQQVEGVKIGDLVGLLLEREEEMIPFIFGIIKSGGVYVPLSTHYPSTRVNSIISDAGLKVLISREQYINALAIEMESGLLDLNTSLTKINEQSLEHPMSKPSGSDLAYVIYTSGSTGNPKGVMIEHHSVVNRLLWMQKEYLLTEEDVLLQKTPLIFDVSIWELFWWSFTGASVYVLAPEEEKEPAKIISAIEKYKVTTAHFVPSMLLAFLDEVERKEDGQLKALRQVFASGEALTVDQVNRFGKTLNRKYATRLINLYGPTEATVDVSYYECEFIQKLKSIPIGKPIDNIMLYIVDKNYQLSPAGVSGELCIGGVGLARGYMKDYPLTKEKFISHPFKPEGRLYRTGDVARWLLDGNVEFLGRLDHQIKIRGFRIELGEIESHLMSYDNIKQAVVSCIEDKGNKKLIAFLVPSENATVNLFEIKKFLRTKLPEYMIPALIRKIDKMPLTTSGKVDVKSLLKSIDNSSTIKTVRAQPRTDIERYIAQTWMELLSIDQINIDDNFFDLGGHSLLLLRANNRINDKYLVDLPLNLYFNRTLEQVAQQIENKLIKIDH